MARKTNQNALRKQNGHRKSLSDREDSKRIPEKKVRRKEKLQKCSNYVIYMLK